MTNNLFVKNGKAKKKYCMCMSPSYIAEVCSVNGHVDQAWMCAESRCPYYSVGCGRENIKRYENKIADFASVWDSKLKKRELAEKGFNADPWVWEIEFDVRERILENENRR